MNNVIIPGILEKDLDSIKTKIELAKTFTDTLHIDIIDGKFTNNTTFLDPEPFKAYSSNMFFELHMMVENPIEYVKPWADAGFKRFLGHIEKMPDQKEFIKVAKQYGEVGLAIDGPTNISAITVPLHELDALLIYTSGQVGFSGPKFIPERLEKIKKIREENQTIPIEVDGGVNDKIIVEAKNAGANRFVSTSFLFGSEDPAHTFHSLQDLTK